MVPGGEAQKSKGLPVLQDSAGSGGTRAGKASGAARDEQPPPRRRQPSSVRRQMIIEAARPLIAERGMHATTVRDIARAADVAVGTVTYHFSGIAEVLAGVLEHEMTDYSTAVWEATDAAPTGRAGLAILCDGLLATGDRATAHWRFWLDFWALAARYENYAEWQERVYIDLHGLAERQLARGHEDGSLHAPDPARGAVEFIGMMDGLVVQAYLPNARITPAAAREILHGFVETTFTPAATS